MSDLQHGNSEFRRSARTGQFDLHIAVVATNTDGLSETGFGSQSTCVAFCEALRERYTNVTFHDVTTKASLNAIVQAKPDLVVLSSKYLLDPVNRTRIWLSKYFLDHGITHTGSTKSALDLDSNKAKAKDVVASAAIRTAKFFTTFPGQFTTEEQLPLPFPVFIKPIDAANSNGIDENSIAHDFSSYRRKVEALFTEFGVNVLVEEVLPGREFTVAIFRDDAHGFQRVMPMEIVVPENVKGDRILGRVTKQRNEEIVGLVNGPLRVEIVEMAEKCFTALDARDFGRIDIKLDGQNRPYFMEANLVPGMGPNSSYFPRACGLEGGQEELENGLHSMSYSDVACMIVELGLDRAEIADANVT